ncbi:MAG: HEAT repeat domain-containing protein [Deltaproteobacteria bacterium]|nr:HEAT repeat domain-containing protein [Deltaproteobacteria bacterium]
MCALPRTVAVVTLVNLILGGLAATAAAAPTRAQVEPLLRGYERAFGRADLKRLGPGTERVLMAIHDDRQADPMVRVRALAALGHAEGPAVQAFLAAVVRRHAGARAGLGTLFLRRAASGLLAVGGAAAIDAVTPLLLHPAADVRAEVGRALGRTGAPRARVALERRLRVERAPVVRAVLEREVRRLRGR